MVEQDKFLNASDAGSSVELSGRQVTMGFLHQLVEGSGNKTELHSTFHWMESEKT